MQLIAVLVFIGILVLLLTLAAYLARSQKSRNNPYRSWSQVLGPQFRGSAFDVEDNLNKEIETGRQQSRRRRRAHHTRSKQR
jgi:copper oxidase (laccase) domain-containing protein